MPYHAVVDGEPIISFDLTDEQWTSLQKRNRKEKCVFVCGFPGYLRKSYKYHTKHFVHNSGCVCKHSPESPEHMLLKWLIYNELKQKGFLPNLDDKKLNDANCKPDVYVEIQTRKIGFEVQLSRQSLETIEVRNKKYIDNGYEVYWLFPDNLNPDFEEYYLEKYWYALYPETNLFMKHNLSSVGVSNKNNILYSGKYHPINEWIFKIIDTSYMELLKNNIKELWRWKQRKDSELDILLNYFKSRWCIIKSYQELEKDFEYASKNYGLRKRFVNNILLPTFNEYYLKLLLPFRLMADIESMTNPTKGDLLYYNVLKRRIFGT